MEVKIAGDWGDFAPTLLLKRNYDAGGLRYLIHDYRFHKGRLILNIDIFEITNRDYWLNIPFVIRNISMAPSGLDANSYLLTGITFERDYNYEF